ncbi:MAG: ABC transporter substrate-binding protein [Lautropia sp.]
MTLKQSLTKAVLACAVALPVLSFAQKPLEETTMAIPATSLSFTVSYIADDLDLWAKHGMKVESKIVRGVGALNAVISKNMEFTQSSGSSFTRAAARGQRMLAIATTIDRPFAQIALRKDLADAGGFDAAKPLAERAKLLKDRTIAVDSVNSVVHAYLRLIAIAGGVDPNAIKITPMEASSMAAAMAAGKIDGFAMTLPWALGPVLDGKAVMLANGLAGDPGDLVPFAHELVVTQPETCAKKKQLCEAMGKVFIDAARYIHADPAGTQAILAKRFPSLSPAVLSAAVEQLRGATPRDARVSEAHLLNVERYNVRAGLLKEEEAVKGVADLFTNDYVR